MLGDADTAMGFVADVVIVQDNTIIRVEIVRVDVESTPTIESHVIGVIHYGFLMTNRLTISLVNISFTFTTL